MSFTEQELKAKLSLADRTASHQTI